MYLLPLTHPQAPPAPEGPALPPPGLSNADVAALAEKVSGVVILDPGLAVYACHHPLLFHALFFPSA
jgi:hypothetical protein